MRQTYSLVKNESIELLVVANEDGTCEMEGYLTSGSSMQPIILFNYPVLQLQCTGYNPDAHHGLKYNATSPGSELKCVEVTEKSEGGSKRVVVKQKAGGLLCVTTFESTSLSDVVRCWTTITNMGSNDVGIEFVSSLCIGGLFQNKLMPRDNTVYVSIPHNTWCGEAQWKTCTLADLGLSRVADFTLKRITCTNSGTWSTSHYIPCGYIEDRETKIGLIWQIESNSAWHWEIGDDKYGLYIIASGPTEREHAWWKNLKPGESFETVPAAFWIGPGDLQHALAQMTLYRRKLKRNSTDHERLPVIFNDYMNCLFGDPTEEKLVPLIQKAAEVGCEVFCIDAGWYADDGDWWECVGEWEPSKKRFPSGLERTIERIKNLGMIAGLWVEIEVMGVRSSLAARLPDDWFFCRHGKRIIDHGRYQLDFRNEGVRKFATSVIERLVEGYGVGYLKIDYNINAGVGTDIGADSLGEGLLGHSRAYLSWLDSIMDKYPHVIFENCGSGGMRLDYAMLSRHSIQSITDQTDYRLNAVIACAAPSVATPEQCAIWAYPLGGECLESTVMNMVNALLMRIHLSGRLGNLDEQHLSLVKQAVESYKKYRHLIRDALPFWPDGLPSFQSTWCSMGIKAERTALVAVWRLGDSSRTHAMNLRRWIPTSAQADFLYPVDGLGAQFRWNPSGIAVVDLPDPYSARILKFHW
ncbi:MAG: alpha-galactosidase [Alicyclobacillus sp.]|nr:alpha-galactosidase [Alicyclobacillus sp.]